MWDSLVVRLVHSSIHLGFEVLCVTRGPVGFVLKLPFSTKASTMIVTNGLSPAFLPKILASLLRAKGQPGFLERCPLLGTERLGSGASECAKRHWPAEYYTSQLIECYKASDQSRSEPLRTHRLCDMKLSDSFLFDRYETEAQETRKEVVWQDYRIGPMARISTRFIAWMSSGRHLMCSINFALLPSCKAARNELCTSVLAFILMTFAIFKRVARRQNITIEKLQHLNGPQQGLDNWVYHANLLVLRFNHQHLKFAWCVCMHEKGLWLEEKIVKVAGGLLTLNWSQHKITHHSDLFQDHTAESAGCSFEQKDLSRLYSF